MQQQIQKRLNELDSQQIPLSSSKLVTFISKLNSFSNTINQILIESGTTNWSWYLNKKHEIVLKIDNNISYIPTTFISNLINEYPEFSNY